MNWSAVLSIVVTACLFMLGVVWRRQSKIETCMATKYCTKEMCQLKHVEVEKRLDRGSQKIDALDQKATQILEVVGRFDERLKAFADQVKNHNGQNQD